MKKLFTLFCLSVILIFAMVSCNNDNSNVKEKVAVMLPSSKITQRWADDAAYLKKALEFYGYEVIMYISDNNPDGAAEQVKQIKQAIDAGISHFVITAIDYKLINESGVLEANQKCDFICHDRTILNNAGVDFLSSCDQSKIGIMQAQFLLQNFRASGKKSMTIELFAGPSSDANASLYYEGAYKMLKPYIDNGSLIVKSGKQTYQDVSLSSWSSEDAQKEMVSRLSSYEAGEAPDMVLAANDNIAEGVILATIAHGFNGQFPVITGQDNNTSAKQNIANGLQGMTIDKELEEMAYNTAMIVNSFIYGNPSKSNHSVNNGVKDIPAIYSSLTLVTYDNLK